MKKLKSPIYIYSIIASILILILSYQIYDIRTGNSIELHVMLLDNLQYGKGKLAPGRYYMDGNKNSFYFEVFDDQTMELGGGDTLDFLGAILGRPPDEKPTGAGAEQWAKFYR